MNILFLASTLPRSLGDGQPDFVLQQAKAWKSLQPSNTVKILAPHDVDASTKETIDNIDIERFKYFWPEKAQKLAYPAILPNIKNNPLLLLQVPFFLLAELWYTRKLVKKYDIDLVYAHWVMPQGIVAYILKKISGQKYILHNHSSDITAFSILGSLGHWLATRIIFQSEKLFCVNKFQDNSARYLIEHSSLPSHQKSRTLEKIIVLPMGVKTPPKETKTQSYKYRFGSISRLSIKKGLNYFLKTCRELSKANPNVRVALAGDGEERENLKHYSQGLQIDFPGYLSGHDKEQFFKDCEFMVFSSVATDGDVEGLPVAMMEALVRGKIILASKDTNITSLPEWPLIRNNIFFINDPTDIATFTETLSNMLELDDDEKLMRSQHLKNEMQRYIWKNLIKEYCDEIVSKNGKL